MAAEHILRPTLIASAQPLLNEDRSEAYNWWVDCPRRQIIVWINIHCIRYSLLSFLPHFSRNSAANYCGSYVFDIFVQVPECGSSRYGKPIFSTFLIYGVVMCAPCRRVHCQQNADIKVTTVKHTPSKNWTPRADCDVTDILSMIQSCQVVIRS